MSKLDIEDLLDSGASDCAEDADANDVSEERHGRLVDRVRALYGSRDVRQRAEASQHVSEFDFSREPGAGVTAYDMLKDLNNTAELKKKRNKVLKIKKKAAALPVPLAKVSRERLQRAIAYTKTSSELGKWDSIVEHNESADQLSFPLNDEPIRLEQSGDFVKRLKPSTDLEAQVESLLSSSKHRLDSDAALSQFEEEQLKALSKEEAIARLSELRRLRALMHTEALRNRRVRKIKSRKFHQIQRKDKMKAAIREFEQLKVTDPQKALEKLEELEQIRREERMSLRHKSKNKWAAQLARKGKFDKDAQAALRERIELGRELETKVKMDEGADEDEDDEDNDAAQAATVAEQDTMEDNRGVDRGASSGEEDREKLERSLQEEEERDGDTPGGTGNPWLRRTFFEEVTPVEGQSQQSISAATDTVVAKVETSTVRRGGKVLEVPERMRTSVEPGNGPREGVDNKPTHSVTKSTESRIIEHEATSGSDDDGDESEELISETTQRLDPYKSQEGSADAEDEKEYSTVEERLKSADEDQNDSLKTKSGLEHMPSISAVYIDPEKVLEVGAKAEKKLKSRLRLSSAVEGCDSGASADDSDESDGDGEYRRTNEARQKKLIQEAFAGDDVVEDFIKEQKDKDASERSAEREAALKQKGLDGDWVTPNNIHRLDDRKRKFLESRKKKFQPRAAIVHEQVNTKTIGAHRVSEVPKGFTRVSDFETMLKQPVGSMFNTHKAFYELTKPRVVTARGKIIRPIDQSALVKAMKAPDLKRTKTQKKAVK